MTVTSEDTYLTAGVFFALLQTALKPRTKTRASLEGKADGLSQTNMMANLIQVVEPEFMPPIAGSTFGSNVSDFRTCKISGGTEYLPIGSSDHADRFNRLLNDEPSLLMERMAYFIDHYLNVAAQGETLIRRLRFLMQKDIQISEKQRFLSGSEYQISKDALLHDEDVCLEVFLTALWHFFVTERLDNLRGQGTFQRLFQQRGMNTRWSFNPDSIPLISGHTVRIHRWDHDSVLQENEPLIIDVDDSTNDEEESTNTAAACDENPGNSYIQQIGQQIIFNQHGANSNQIHSVENLFIGGSR